MSADAGDFAARIAAFPQLERALGSRWIEEQEAIDPVLSRFRIARWLRIPGFEPDLKMLDEVLAQLDGVPGIADRRRRLRSDAPALTETLTELYFAAWLQNHGYRFDLPAAGADVALDVGAAAPLHIEATTPRKAAWAEDLFERIDLISKRTGFSAEIEFRLERLPDPVVSDEVVEEVVQTALARLSAVAERAPVVQEDPAVGLTIRWTPDVRPSVGGITSPKPTSPYWGWNQVVNAAREKARQLPDTEGGVLLVGTRQMPTLEWEHFLDMLRNERPEDLKLDWSLLPPQVTFIILWSFVLRQVEPFSGMFLWNPVSPFPIGPEVAKFFNEEFSQPLRPPEIA